MHVRAMYVYLLTVCAEGQCIMTLYVKEQFMYVGTADVFVSCMYVCTYICLRFWYVCMYIHMYICIHTDLEWLICCVLQRETD
jgi:hypothetical protein